MNKLVMVFILVYSGGVSAGSFIFAGEANGVDIIAHPTGYDGVVDVVNVSVCIDPTGDETTLLESPVKNIVTTFNNLRSESGNIISGSANNIPSGALDWESVALHEVGHCLGLAHPNLGSQTGVSGANTNFTASTDGADNAFDFDDGADNIKGTSDDLRDDDINLHWYNTGINNPFVLTPPYDSSNYSRTLAGLPGGHTYVTNASLEASSSLGAPSSEAVMQQGSRSNEDQRELGADDEATLRYAMSGVDQTSGTADDYTFNLTYGGITTGCDIMIKHHDISGLAFCSVGGSFISGSSIQITGASIEIDAPDFTWFFNDVIFKDDNDDPD
ncbi:hypothetical protein ACFODZ_05435 [Marinicella sediminis]|uniref:Peptidase M10 metallopeptidase domain-containing protein n=1 Tax=Marinicella sediminis TaxID=1792834 RepID=A0ABV7J9Y0_9GAMM|nr:hypothetical protein [Marinicella sediminis]